MRAVLLGVLIGAVMVTLANAVPAPSRDHLLRACGAGCGRYTIRLLPPCASPVRPGGACARLVRSETADPPAAGNSPVDGNPGRGVTIIPWDARGSKPFGDRGASGAENAR